MITSKTEFINRFRDMAERDADIVCPKDREAYLENWFEHQWQEHLRWYKEEYPKKYRESLTLEQLYRLDH